MRVDPITVKRFDKINTQLTSVAAKHTGPIFHVFSLHSEDDPIFGGVFARYAAGMDYYKPRLLENKGYVHVGLVFDAS